MANTTNGRSPLLLWAVAAVLVVLIFFGVRRLTREELPLRVAEASYQDLEIKDSTNGKVEPQANFEAHAPAPATVKKLYVHSGDKVRKGQLLLALDDADAVAHAASALAALRSAQATDQAAQQGGTQEERAQLRGELSRARLERDQAQRDLDALKKLAAQGAAAPSEVAAAQQRLQVAQSALAVSEQRTTSRYSTADLANTRAALSGTQAAYAAANETVSNSNVRSATDGTVYYLPVSQSEFVQQGQLMLEVADLTKLQVRAYFDEPELGALRVNQPATIVWDALPDRLWHGHVLHIPSTIISYGTRNVGEVLVSVDDADGRLLPNTDVKVTVLEQKMEHVLTVPREALHSENGKSYVYRMEKNVLRRVPVNVGARNLTQVEITSGLTEHDVVALSTTNGEPLAEGVPVQVDR
jgi:HlyD family secretion protein